MGPEHPGLSIPRLVRQRQEGLLDRRMRLRALAVAQLAEWSTPTSEMLIRTPPSANLCVYLFSANGSLSNALRNEIMENEAGNVEFDPLTLSGPKQRQG